MLNTIVTTARCEGLFVHSPRQESVPSSRATRVVDDPTRFLFVSIGKSTKDEALRRFLTRVAKDGVNVEGTHYNFLGFTESHVKSGRIVFFREDDNWTVARLLERFGDLQHIFEDAGYGKYAKRLGLSFSATVESLNVPHEQAIKLDDYYAADGSIHSDGCGMIRDSFAAEVCRFNDLPPDTNVFQIRRGGIKGLLVRYPDEKFDRFCYDTNSRTWDMPMHVIAYRPSMLKYEGGPTVLELNNYAHYPRSARLNVQFILLLLTLGIRREVFEKLLKEQLDLIGCISHDRDQAEKYIKGELDADNSSFNQDLFALLLAKHDLNEPYVHWRLKQFQKQQYETLRKKLNLSVEESCYIYGVIDEDGVLKEDEVFLNVPGRTGVLDRNVLVSRNPSYLPEDFRVFRAVNYDGLRHHKNCIVFSRNAAHSIPDTMASGDLDGDEYFVTWDPALIPDQMPNPQQRQSPQTQRRHSVRFASDMSRAAVDTFVQHRHNHLLGTMVNAWGEAVELTPQLANASFAKSLVPLIESAHDMLKTGDDPEELKRQFNRLWKRPSNGLASYRSPLQDLRDLIPHEDLSKIDKFECDPTLIIREEDHEGWQFYLSEASRVCVEYNRDLADAIRDDEDAENYETASSREDSRKRPKRSDRVKDEYRSRYFGGGTFTDQYYQRIRASAWYAYGYSKRKQAFAWLGERYLNEIRACWTNGKRPILYVGSSAPSSGGSQPASSSMSDKTLREKLSPALRSETSFMATLPSIDENRISILSNPKPKEPVASQLPACTASDNHSWRIVNANQSSRRYQCKECSALVKERKDGNFWTSESIQCPNKMIHEDMRPPASEIASPRSLEWDSIARANTHHTQHEPAYCNCDHKPELSPVTLPQNTGDEAKSSSPDGRRLSLVKPLNSPSPRRSSASTFSGISAILEGFSRLPTARRERPRSVSSGNATPRSAQISSDALPTSVSVLASVATSPAMSGHASFYILVRDNPKPSCPVGTRNIPGCHLQTGHRWKIWANAKARHYSCDCGTKIKERKSGNPAVWEPYS
ncbi:hypothetical protein AcW1_004042 [Taiwanofungus camphoratus]|nr:hypothetical protein AcW1_004042 [Antrodia cinnamomea]